jgi:phosphoglycolate phosphatase-like HAD superfamily hydrolase
MNPEKKPVAYFDMDGTLADYEGALVRDLGKLKSPEEPKLGSIYRADLPSYIKERAKLIKNAGSWWENLDRFQLGWDILGEAKNLNFRIVILTQGPRNNAEAWSHKLKWCDKHLPDIEVCITRDKGLHYGRVLVDDYPEYITRWLEYRPRGVVIMPAHDYNEDFKHKNVVRYDGTNLDKVRAALSAAYNR